MYQAMTGGKLEWKGQALMLFVGFCETFNREAEGEPCCRVMGQSMVYQRLWQNL